MANEQRSKPKSARPRKRAKKAVLTARSTLRSLWRLRWFRQATGAAAVVFLILCGVATYYYVFFARQIDHRLAGERDRVLPRVLARPLELTRGEALTEAQLVDRLNDLGYTERTKPEKPGEFAIDQGSIGILPRSPDFKGRLVKVSFDKRTGPAPAGPKRPAPKLSDRVERLELGADARDRVTLDAPVLTSLITGEREKRRPMALSAIPRRMVDAVLAIEDHRYYEHPGVDLIGTVGALVTNIRGNRAYLAGGSTITQQLVRNEFLPSFGMSLQEAREKSIRRKLLEVYVSVVVTHRATKDQILEMYLNSVPLGQRGSFAIYGVPEATRLFFGKDLTNVTLAEAATIAGVIQSPSALSPFTNAARCRARRNVVLQAMADNGYVTQAQADAAAKEPLTVVQRALEAEAPYFVDYVGQILGDQYPGLTTTTDQGIDVYTTLDLHLQRLAQDAMRDGLTKVDDLLARRKKKGHAEAALISVDVKTGQILAFVGGRSYNQSQYNRAVVARRQPGSVFKPFVYLTAFEQALADGRTDVTPASIVDDSPTTWEFDDQVWTPENYEQEYDGPITFRRALAHSRNIAAIKVAQSAGYDHVAALWKKIGVTPPPKAYPSIALGVFEATPFEVATAYTLFPNMGTIRPLDTILKITRGTEVVAKKPVEKPRTVTRRDTTFLVTNMMRSVLNEGTAAGARSAGFSRDAAGKTGTTNDLRDAWFAGFTPDLLTVVWVGFDDNQPLGLTGAQAALPIWTQFMIRALAGRPDVPFDEPDGVVFADIDADTGKLSTPACPRVIREGFLAGTEPAELCELHR